MKDFYVDRMVHTHSILSKSKNAKAKSYGRVFSVGFQLHGGVAMTIVTVQRSFASNRQVNKAKLFQRIETTQQIKELLIRWVVSIRWGKLALFAKNSDTKILSSHLSFIKHAISDLRVTIADRQSEIVNQLNS